MAIVVSLLVVGTVAAELHRSGRSLPTASSTTIVPSGSVNLGLVDTFAGYGNIVTYGPTVQAAGLGLAESAHPSAIRFDLGFAPWIQGQQQVISEDESLWDQAKASGAVMVLADAASESYRGSGNQLSWAQFQQAWVNRVSVMASTFKPAYYIVVKEPGWYQPMIQGYPLVTHYNAGQWGNLTAQLVQAVHTASPSTQVGVAVSGGSLASRTAFDSQYLRDCEAIPGVAFIGLDLYGPTDMANAQRFVSAYGTGGKALWIAEAWSQPKPDSSAQGDALWLPTAIANAQSLGATWLFPFYLQDFATYSPPSSQVQLAQVLSTQRTPIFSEFAGTTS